MCDNRARCIGPPGAASQETLPGTVFPKPPNAPRHTSVDKTHDMSYNAPDWSNFFILNMAA